MIRGLLVEAKGILVECLQKIEWDHDSVEYLIDSIDYLLNDQIPLTPEVIDILLQDILITSTYHKKSRLIEVVKIFYKILEMLPCTI